MTGQAIAETPSPMLLGTKRVVLSCDFDETISATEAASLCAQLVKKAQRYTDLPVKLATSADLSASPNLRQKADQLLLRVKARASDAPQGRKTLSLEVTPVRLARPMGAMPAIKSSLSMAQVRGDWVLQGPVDAFNQLLGGTQRMKKPLSVDS